MLVCWIYGECCLFSKMPQFLVFVLVIVYVGGIWKFLSGFRRTNFNSGLPGRISLALLWPVLLVANKSYRRNFQKALKGR